MKKTILFSLSLALATTSLTFGAARQPRVNRVLNDAPGIARLHVFNDSTHNIEAIETFLRRWDNEHTPWMGIVSSIAPGGEESLKFSTYEMYHFFPYIQLNKTIYELAPSDGKPFNFAQNDYIRFFDKDDGQPGAEFYSNGVTRSLDFLPIFEGTWLEHVKS